MSSQARANSGDWTREINPWSALFHPADLCPIPGLPQPPAVGLPLVPQRVQPGGDDEGIRLAGEVFLQKRGGVGVIPVVRREVKLPVLAEPLGGEDIPFPVLPDRRERGGLGEWSL